MNLSKRKLLIDGARAAVGVSAVSMLGASLLRTSFAAEPAPAAPGKFEVSFSDAEWKKRLSPEGYQILRHEGTEAPYSSPLNGEHRAGKFACAGCSLDLFSSKTKFDSGTGWPSFWQPLPMAVAENRDTSFGTVRTEIHCRRCGGHLGHVFDDGPKPTGLRYCMNGYAMSFLPAAA